MNLVCVFLQFYLMDSLKQALNSSNKILDFTLINGYLIQSQFGNKAQPNVVHW